MLSIEAPMFRLGERILAESLSILVPPQEVHALTGPNGCGKTLLLDAIGGLIKAPNLTCGVNGVSLADLSASKRWNNGVRRLFQHPVLPPSLKVGHILSEVGVTSLDHVGELLHSLRISVSSTFSQLSFGQKRIVELCATAGASSAILLDEPFAGIAPSSRQAVRAFIGCCAKSGPAVLCVDHLHLFNESLYFRVHPWPVSDASTELPILEECRPFNRIAPAQTTSKFENWNIRLIQINDRIIIKDFELLIESGTVTVVAGDNGSGKSTLIRAISGISQPSSAMRASIADSTVQRDLTFSPQPPKLVPELTIQQNLSLMIHQEFAHPHCNLLGLASELLCWLCARDVCLKTLAGNLSGGEAALCALVGGVLSTRSMIILDEPLEGLSPRVRDRAIQFINHFADQGQTFVITAHFSIMETLKHFHILNLDRDAPLSGKMVVRRSNSTKK